jgi:hypothetical protein
VCGDRGGTDVLLNLVLFTPLGFGIGLTTRSWRRAVLAGAALSLAIELLQLTVVVGRDASLSDLVTNTVGAGIGALLALRVERFLRPAPPAAWRLTLSGCVSLLALAAAAAWLEQPDTGDLVSSTWGAPPEREVFPGRVLSVTIDGRPAPPLGAGPDSALLARALREGRMTIEARVITGQPSPHRRWIHIIGERHSPNGFLSQEGRAAVLGVPARSLHYRLNSPSVMLPRAFPPDSGAEVTLRAGQRAGTLWIRADREGERKTVAIGLSPAGAWTLIAPFRLPLAESTRWVTGLVVLVALLPLGYWGAASHRGPRAAALLAATLVGGLAILPAIAGLPPVHWSEWLAGVAGAAAGWALLPGAAYLQARCGSPSTSESFSS